MSTLENFAQDESFALEKKRTKKSRLILAATIAFAVTVKLMLAFSPKGSLDILIWTQFMRDIIREGGGVYHRPYEVTYFNHPPFMIHVCYAWVWLKAETGLPLPFLIRAPAILADLGSLWILAHLLLIRQNPFQHLTSLNAQSYEKLTLWATAPVSIAISGFHGNTDACLIFFFLLCVFCLEFEYSIFLAGCALGLAFCIKVAPLMFLPALFFHLGWKRFAFLTVTACFVFFAAGLPYIAYDTTFILQKVFGYGGAYGWWGLSRLASWLPSDLKGLDVFFQTFGVHILKVALIALAWWVNSLKQRPRLFEQCALICLSFFVLTPSFGTQYLAWLLPFIILLSWRSQIVFHTTTAMFLLFVYFGWYYFGTSASHPALGDTFLGKGGQLVEMICWITISILTMRYGNALRLGNAQKPSDTRKERLT